MPPTTLQSAADIFGDCFRTAFHREPRLDVSDWAERNRIITLGDAIGPWGTRRVEYLREIMNRFGVPGTRQITIMAAAQTAKTEALVNMLFAAIDQRPGLCMYVYPNEKVAQKQNRLRVMPAAEACPAIARRFLGAALERRTGRGGTMRAKTGLLLTFDRMSVSFVGSNSPANLEGLPCLYVIVDELDRCHPETLGLVRERVKAYPHSSVVVLAGTPGIEGEGIAAEYLQGDKRRFLVPCPHCRQFHRRLFSRVRWPRAEGLKPHEADQLQAERLAYYVCPACSRDIHPEHFRPQLERGVWCPEGCTVAEDGALVGTPPETDHASYHIPGLLSGLQTNPCGYAARRYIQLRGVPDQNFITRVLGDPYQLKGDGMAPMALRKLIPAAGEPGSFGMLKPLATGGDWVMAPAEVLAVTMAADIQPRLAYATLRGWGVYGRESWLLWAGKIDLPAEGWLKPLDGLLARRIRTADGRVLGVRGAAIDSGHRAHDVYDYCRPHLMAGRYVYPVKGASRPFAEERGTPIRWSMLEAGRTFAQQEAELKAVNARALVPRLLLVDTAYFKGAIFGALGGRPDLDDDEDATPGQPRWHLPHDVTDAYLDQITAERMVRVRTITRRHGVRMELVWQCRPGREDNHWGDAGVYDAALGEALNVRALTPRATPGPAPATPTPRELPETREKPQSDYLRRAREMAERHRKSGPSEFE